MSSNLICLGHFSSVTQQPSGLAPGHHSVCETDKGDSEEPGTKLRDLLSLLVSIGWLQFLDVLCLCAAWESTVCWYKIKHSNSLEYTKSPDLAIWTGETEELEESPWKALVPISGLTTSQIPWAVSVSFLFCFNQPKPAAVGQDTTAPDHWGCSAPCPHWRKSDWPAWGRCPPLGQSPQARGLDLLVNEAIQLVNK